MLDCLFKFKHPYTWGTTKFPLNRISPPGEQLLSWYRIRCVLSPASRRRRRKGTAGVLLVLLSGLLYEDGGTPVPAPQGADLAGLAEAAW